MREEVRPKPEGGSRVIGKALPDGVARDCSIWVVRMPCLAAKGCRQSTKTPSWGRGYINPEPDVLVAEGFEIITESIAAQWFRNLLFCRVPSSIPPITDRCYGATDFC